MLCDIQYCGEEHVQNVMRRLFLGLAPERAEDLEQLWTKYEPQFRLFGDDGGPMLAAGAYKYVHFNHRVLRVIWVSAFAAWEAYCCAHSAIADDAPTSHSRLQDLLDLALEIRDAESPLTVPLRGLPEPGSFPEEAELRVPAELATFATGWAMLHEVRHLMHQQEGTSYGLDATPTSAHEEELSCDRYGAEFLMAKVSEYARVNSVSIEAVRSKRALGVYFGVVSLILLSHPHWKASDTHPAVSARLRAIVPVVSQGFDAAAGITALALVGLKRVWPAAPDFTPNS